MVLLFTALTHASDVILTPHYDRPIAPRGGVMLLPVTLSEGIDLPMPEVVDAQGRRLPAYLIELVPRQLEHRRARRWTQDVLSPQVRPRRIDGRPGEAILLVECPGDGEGALMIDRHRINPHWRTPRQPSIPEVLGPMTTGAAGRLSIKEAHHLPDPEQPIEHFRWVLLADELGLEPPGTERFTAEEAKLAEAIADLWRIGLGRLADISPGVARACRRALIAHVHDGDVKIAAWVTNPALLDDLLRILLDIDRSDRRLLSDALTWSDLVPPLLAWTETYDQESVTVSVLHRGHRDLDATASWDADDDRPLDLTIPAGRVSQQRIARPQMHNRLTTGSRSMPLRIDAAGTSIHIDVPPAVERAAPPGPLMGPLLPPLTLVDVELRRPPTTSPRSITMGELRQRNGRWEVFLECRRPAVSGETPSEDRSTAETPWREMIGQEAVTILLGDPSAPRGILTVPESGWWRLLHGENDGSLQVFRRSLDDRWYCRIVLPVEWLRITEKEPFTAISIVRTHDKGTAYEIMPRGGVPWRLSRTARLLDLVYWDDLP